MEKATISGSLPAKKPVIYDKLRGVDFSTDPALISPARSPFAPNLVSGPGGYPEKRVGWETVKETGSPIRGIFSAVLEGEEICVVHCGGKLQLWDRSTNTMTELMSGVGDGFSQAAVFQGKLWIVTGTAYCVVQRNEGTVSAARVSENPYIPEVLIAASMGAEPGGTVLEDGNLLSGLKKAGYIGNGTDDLLVLPHENVSDVTVELRNSQTGEWETLEEQTTPGASLGSPYFHKSAQSFSDAYHVRDWYLTVESDQMSSNKKDYVVDYELGVVGFRTKPWDNTAAGSDNVRVTYRAQADGADLNGCTVIGVYANRLWLTGHPDKPNYDWHSGAEDGTYFPELGYSMVGADGTEILGYRSVGSAQAVIKAEAAQDASIFLRTESTLQGEKAFSLKQGISGMGAVAKRAFCNLLDDPLFVTRTGIYGITSNLLTEERTAANRSRFIDPLLTREPHLKDAVACQWNGMYLLSMTDGTVYVMDGKQSKVYAENNLTGGSYVYECYHWTNIPATCWMSRGEELIFGTAEGKICRFKTDDPELTRFSDDGTAITACRATRLECCGDFMRYKTMTKKGSGVMLEPYSRSSVKVCVRTDRDLEKQIRQSDITAANLDIFDWDDIDFARFTFEIDNGPRIIPFKKKIKKWKWIQIYVRNDGLNEGFGVYGIIIRVQHTNLA